MLLSDLLRHGIDTVSSAYPEREAGQMVFSLLESFIGTKRHTHIVEPRREVRDEELPRIMDAFNRLASGEPLQYVTGKAWFYGREFNVTPDVLIPRPETELLCRIALEKLPVAGVRHPRILDLCTGSGCIAWTMALERPGCNVSAVDVSEGALQVASAQDFYDEISVSGALAPVFVRADVLAGNLPEEVVPQDCRFDMVLSNPPYVMESEKTLMRRNVLEHEPALALFVPDGDPLLFYRAIAYHASHILSDDGAGLVEINEALGPQTARVFHEAGFGTAQVLDDLSSRNRYVYFRKS